MTRRLDKDSLPQRDAGPHILLVNPWIHDFAAYDVWSKPYGLLYLGALLRFHGISVSYIDCLNRFHPKGPHSNPNARHGRGPYLKTPIPNPKGLEDIRRTYSRYGIAPAWFREDLASLQPAPDLIMVTSIMTYWYPGVIETIDMLKAALPEVPVVLGGIYARLCTAHARSHSGADEVVTDTGEGLWDMVKRHTGQEVKPRLNWSDWDSHPYPAFDLQSVINYVPLLTRQGCPFDCAYCAARFLQPSIHQRSPEVVVEEIGYWHQQYGVADFAFYDDALLIGAEKHAIPLLEEIIRRKWPVFFHTPNALHISSITRYTARLMARASFRTLRLGLETTDFETRGRLDHKVTADQFKQAVGHLKAAGFDARQVGAYLLVGLPGQDLKALYTSIDTVKAAGITPILAHFTPIPHTRLWDAAVNASRYDLTADPVYANNAIFPCRQESFSWSVLSDLKRYISSH
jgi:hypothetical protein